MNITERSAALDQGAVLRWMKREAANHETSTQLAEAAAAAFDVDDDGGPLDDEHHWIWELALEANEERPKGRVR